MFITILISLILSNSSSSLVLQSSDIKGKIVDSKSNEPVSYAHIVIEGTTQGTVANAEGNFTLKIPSGSENSNLTISHVGYEKLSISIKSISSNSTVSLTPLTTILDEVVVSSLNPFDILKESANRKKINYPTTPSVLSGFYRHGIKIDSTYTQFLESNLDIVLPHYGLILDNAKVDREVYVNEIRAFESNNYYSISPYRLFDDLFFIPISVAAYDAEIIREETNDSEYVIKASPKQRASGFPEYVLKIDKTSYAYKEVNYSIPNEFWVTKAPTKRTVTSKSGSQNITESRTKFSVVYSFSTYKDKWYLKQVSQHSKFLITSDEGNKRNVTYFIDYVTQNVTEGKKDLVKRNLLSKEENLYSLKRKNNNSFWKQTTILEPSSDEAEMIRIIESSNPE